MLLSALAGGVAGFVVAIRLFFRRDFFHSAE